MSSVCFYWILYFLLFLHMEDRDSPVLKGPRFISMDYHLMKVTFQKLFVH